MNHIVFVLNHQRFVRIRCPNMPHLWACNLAKKTKFLTVDQITTTKKTQVEKETQNQKAKRFHYLIVIFIFETLLISCCILSSNLADQKLRFGPRDEETT